MNIPRLLIFLVVVVIPAWYINKWMLRVTKPKDSFKGFFLYLLLSILVAILYAGLFVLIITTVWPVQ